MFSSESNWFFLLCLLVVWLLKVTSTNRSLGICYFLIFPHTFLVTAMYSWVLSCSTLNICLSRTKLFFIIVFIANLVHEFFFLIFLFKFFFLIYRLISSWNFFLLLFFPMVVLFTLDHLVNQLLLSHGRFIQICIWICFVSLFFFSNMLRVVWDLSISYYNLEGMDLTLFLVEKQDFLLTLNQIYWVLSWIKHLTTYLLFFILFHWV